MKAISILVLLCSAASVMEALTCSEESAAAKIAMDHINEHHHHGYKFNLTGVELYETDLKEELCIMKLRLNLTETNCHIINPKPYKDCESRSAYETSVIANCTVEILVKKNEGSVNKYDCDTKRVDIDGCPDCPTLINLNDQTGQLSVSKAVTDFNKNTSNDHYYILQDIGRISLGYMFHAGMGYFAEFALVETHCPRESKIVPEACRPLCPDRAHHAFCKSSFTTLNGLMSVECEFYPPENTTVLDKEPVCPQTHPHPGGPPPRGPPGGPPPHAGSGGRPPHVGWGGPPPHTRPGGPPLHAGSGGPPPHAGWGGPPPHAGPGGPPPHAGPVGPPPHPPPCIGLLEFDRALHPICPWPIPEISQDPRPSDS